MTKTKVTLLLLLVLLTLLSTSCITVDTDGIEEDIGEVGDEVIEAYATPNAWSEALMRIITDN